MSIKSTNVVFVGGAWPRLSSVEVRCVQVAEALDCDYLVNTTSARSIPDKYNVFVLVKTRLPLCEIEELAKRGRIVWDILDNNPPSVPFIKNFIVSTSAMAERFCGIGEITTIRHHHCNFTGRINRPRLKAAGWVGSKCWIPDLNGVKFDCYISTGMSLQELEFCYHRIGIGINIHKLRIGNNHAPFNTGLKLINCIGFGIPSVSLDEKAYKEIGMGCTLFSRRENFLDNLRILKDNEALYNSMHEACVSRSSLYDIRAVRDTYYSFIKSIDVVGKI